MSCYLWTGPCFTRRLPWEMPPPEPSLLNLKSGGAKKKKKKRFRLINTYKIGGKEGESEGQETDAGGMNVEVNECVIVTWIDQGMSVRENYAGLHFLNFSKSQEEELAILTGLFLLNTNN